MEERPGAELPCLALWTLGQESSRQWGVCALWGDEEHPPPRLCTKSWKPEMPLGLGQNILRVSAPERRSTDPEERRSRKREQST